MAYTAGTDAPEMQDIRGENVDRAVKGFALMEYKMKQVCLVQTSDKWKETYYKETKTELYGLSGAAIKGVPRLAAFPYGEETWTETSARHNKFGFSSIISWEDVTTDSIDVLARTLLRIARGITKAVDYEIYRVITSDANVNTLAVASGQEWDSDTIAARDPIADILHGIEYISVDNYDPLKNGYLLINPVDYTNLLMNSKVINNPSFKTADVVSNGVVGQICGLKIIVSSQVVVDECCIICGQEAVTWKQASPLKTNVEYDSGVKYTIKAWEVGVVMVTNPEAIHIITNIRK